MLCALIFKLFEFTAEGVYPLAFHSISPDGAGRGFCLLAKGLSTPEGGRGHATLQQQNAGGYQKQNHPFLSKMGQNLYNSNSLKVNADCAAAFATCQLNTV